jgi:hypothetical protein
MAFGLVMRRTASQASTEAVAGFHSSVSGGKRSGCTRSSRQASGSVDSGIFSYEKIPYSRKLVKFVVERREILTVLTKEALALSDQDLVC